MSTEFKAPPSAGVAPESVTAVTAAAPATILLAEDDPVTRMLLTRSLKKAGYEVEAVADGMQALKRMTHRYYPMLLTDWEMPEMDGLALCRAVRNLQLDGYVYVLLLTARDAKEHIVAGLEAGADDYLVKPVHELELAARLNAGRRILTLEHSLRAANERNLLISITDALTGTFNRRYLMDQLPREVERARRYGNPLSVIMCDIDHFKRMNDTCGHAAGDEVLQQFTARVQRSIRGNSDWIARYGGEEFVIVLPETAAPGAMIVAEKIRACMNGTPFVTRAGEATVSASFGVASCAAAGPDLALKAEMLIRAADECLYLAKNEGRNCTRGIAIPSAAPLDRP